MIIVRGEVLDDRAIGHLDEAARASLDRVGLQGLGDDRGCIGGADGVDDLEERRTSSA